MNEKNYKLLEMFGEMDDSYVMKAGKPWKKKSGRKWRPGGLQAACAALVITFGMLGAFHPQVKAAVRELFSHIGQLAGRQEDFAPYANPMELAQTKDGVTLTLQEVAATDSQLYAALSMDTSLEHAEIADFRFSFKELEENIHTSYSTGFFSGSSKENGYVLKFSGEDGILTEDAEVTLYVTVCENPEEAADSKKIPFEFTFSASGSKLKQDTLEIPLDQKIEIKPGTVLELEAFSLNSIFSRIRTKCGEHDGSLPASAMYYLKGSDSLGKEVLYTYESESGPYGHFATEEDLEGSIPSSGCEWVELQLYALDLPEGQDAAGGMRPIGEKFRIDLVS